MATGIFPHCTLRQRLGESRGYALVEVVEQAS